LNPVAIKPDYSVLKEDELLKIVVPLFQISEIIDCKQYYEGANDSYKVFTANKNYLLRIYSHNWRRHSEIEFEIEALLHLHAKKAHIAFPIATKDDNYILPISAPEGIRYAIMLSFAEGNEFWDGNIDIWKKYAANIADIHSSSEDFKSPAQRFYLDRKHLLEQPEIEIGKYISAEHQNHNYIFELIERLKYEYDKLSKQKLDYGFCHGDLHGGNAHLNNGEMVFFDFDCCGYGYRAYDLAVFKWNLKLNGNEERWGAFIDTYLQKRELCQSDLNSIDLFVIIRHIWMLGFHNTYKAPLIRSSRRVNSPAPEIFRFHSRLLTICAESHLLSEGIILPRVAELVCTKHI
jgi:Ser/Thr protein kinase RdoA (MazF antagonist)